MSNQIFNYQIDAPLIEDINFLTIVSEGESGLEQRYQKWTKPKRIFRLVMRARAQVDTASMWRFYVARKGSFDSFLFENPTESPVTAEIIGSGDGAKTVFYLGSNVDIGTGDLIVSTGSAVITKSLRGTGDYLPYSTYSINEPIGQITTSPAVPSGDVLKATYNYFYRVRFKEDMLTRENFSNGLWNLGLDLIEVI